MRAFLLSLLLLAVPAMANSIFSFHGKGLGYPALRLDGRIGGMGGTMLSITDGDNISGTNPATLTACDVTTLSAGVLAQSRSAEDASGVTATFYEQYPRMVRLIVPVGYGIRIGAGLVPIGDVRSVWTYADDGGDASVAFRDSLEATGALWGGALEVARRFGPVSTGLRLQVVSGTMDTEWRRTIEDGTTPLATSALLERHITGFTYGLGLVYHAGEHFTAGLLFEPESELDQRTFSSLGSRVPSRYFESHEGGISPVPDRNDTTSSTVSYPQSIGAGVTWESGDRLMASADIYYARWSQVTEDFNDAWRVSLGMEIHPSTDYRSLFFLQWPYRLGFRMEEHYIPYNGEAPGAWYLSLGMGIPLGENYGRIDYGFEYGKRGSLDTNTATETVWRHTISIVVRERWFQYRPRR